LNATSVPDEILPSNDDALKLARGLRAALDKMNVKKPI